jgi:hypothetical protein
VGRVWVGLAGLWDTGRSYEVSLDEMYETIFTGRFATIRMPYLKRIFDEGKQIRAGLGDM